MTAFICRHETQVNTQPVTWEGCEEPAAVGIVTEAETGDLMLFPVCTEHARRNSTRPRPRWTSRSGRSSAWRTAPRMGA